MSCADTGKIFAIINASFLPPIYFFYPETKGLSLEAIDLLFQDPDSREDGHEGTEVPQLNEKGADMEVEQLEQKSI